MGSILSKPVSQEPKLGDPVVKIPAQPTEDVERNNEVLQSTDSCKSKVLFKISP